MYASGAGNIQGVGTGGAGAKDKQVADRTELLTYVGKASDGQKFFVVDATAGPDADATVKPGPNPWAQYQYNKAEGAFLKIGEHDSLDVTLSDLDYTNPAYPALTNQQEVNDELLYFNPAVTVLINGQGGLIFEKPLNPITINLKWTANKSVNSALVNGVEQLAAPATTQTLNGFQDIASDLAASAQTFSFGVTVNDGKNAAGQTRYARLVYPFYAGLAAAKPANAADVQALTKYVKTKSSTTINIPAATPLFPVVAYPAVYGNISSVIYSEGFNSDVISGHDALYDIADVPMADGSDQTYRVMVATKALDFPNGATYTYHF